MGLSIPYQLLIFGSGQNRAVFDQQAKATGKSVLVIDKRQNIAGNKELKDAEEMIILSGRLIEYKYYDTETIIVSALECVEGEVK